MPSLVGMTNFVDQDLATIMADRLQQLFNFRHETYHSVSSVQIESYFFFVLRTDVEDRYSKLNVTEMPWTFRHAFIASGTLDPSVDGSQFWVCETFLPWTLILLVHRLWILNFGYTNILDFFR